MDFYGIEICFRVLFKVSVFAEIFDPWQKFLSLKSTWVMLKFCDFFNFQGVPAWTLEISGRQNWANVGNLGHFAQNERKKQQMLKNDDFWPFWRYEIFEKILTHNSNFQKVAQSRRNFCPTSKIIKIGKINVKELLETPARIFWPILASVSIWD